MHNFQFSLFYDYHAIQQSSGFYRKYDALFSVLDLSGFTDINTQIGRTGYSRHAILRALIVKHLEEIQSIPRLIEFLDSHPMLTEMCGFTMGCLPDESQFYRFLKEVPNGRIQAIHTRMNTILINRGIATLDTFVIDSKPVKAATRENNHKNPNRNTRNKNKKPLRNPQATLHYYSYQKKTDGSKTFEFFWGYRTHVITSIEGIPLVETTLPNNRTDARVAKTLIKKLKRLYTFKRGAFFIADSAYDERDIYEFIIDHLKCKAFIPLNPRNTQKPKSLGTHGSPICDAGLEMAFEGAWHEGKRHRVKFRCPIKTERKHTLFVPKRCPVNHHRFTEGAGYGCTKYIDVTDDARSRAPRNSTLFKHTYKKRIVVEQYFSRLGKREAEQTTHYKLRSVKNQMTIAHLSQTLIALAAVLLQRTEKIRCYRTFAHAS
jgi:hypothetical protein